MHGDPKSERAQVKQDRHWVWHHSQLRQRNAHDDATEGGVYDAVESELFGRDGKLAIDGQHEQRVQFSGAD